jgi:threonine dehydrogenase-like Zn-dependent dehydrogenase
MQALVFNGKLFLETDYPLPEPGPGEALIRVRLAGICNTDLELIKGYMQFQGIPGHEFVGIVERAPGAEKWEGRRVVGEINSPCRECEICRSGRPTHCPNRTTLGISGRSGAFAEYLTLPVCNLLPVPDSLDDESAVFVEPLAAACEILQQVHIRPTDRLIVLGDGKLGLLCAQVMALTGCDLMVVGHHPEKLHILTQKGIRTALEGTFNEDKADVIIETTGQVEGFQAARRMVRPRGTIVLKSTYHGPIEADLTMIVVDEITLIGSRCGPFAPALSLLERGLVEVKPLIQALYPFSDILTAFTQAGAKGTLKILVDIPH